MEAQLKSLMTPEEYIIWEKETAAAQSYPASIWSGHGCNTPSECLRGNFATAFRDNAQFYNFVQEFFKRSTAPYDASFMPNVPKVFDISEDGSCITDVRATDITVILLKALECVNMKREAKEEELNPGTGVTFAGTLGLLMEVLELEIGKIWRQSELQPEFNEIKSYFNIDVNFELQRDPQNETPAVDRRDAARLLCAGLNGCIMRNIKKVLEKLSVLVKHIKLSMFVGQGSRAIVEQRAIFNNTMSLYQFAICFRVCGQIPDVSICGDMPINDLGEDDESISLALLALLSNVYTPTMKSNKKAAEAQKNRQLMRERRAEKKVVEKAAKEKKEAVLSAAEWEKAQAVKVALE